MTGTLFIVATPIGNLGDFSERGVRTLKEVALIACEDTRMTRRLTGHFGIATPMSQYHEHNAEKMRPVLIGKLLGGESVALVSDAGTPLISDPGYKLVREAQDAGIAVAAVPGASSVIAALSIAGLPTDRFLFAGFLSPKSAARQKELHSLAQLPVTLVLLEAANRVRALLQDILAVLGDREVALAREITKRYEEVRRMPASALLAQIEAAPIKGECVVLIGGAGKQEAAFDSDALLRRALETMHVGDAARHVAALTGEARKTLYERAMAIKRD